MKYLICLGLSLAFAQAAVGQDRGGAYMGLSLGSFSYEEEITEYGVTLGFDDTTTAYRILGGYRFTDNFALEGGWGKTGDVEDSQSFFGIPVNFGVEFEVLTVRALGILPFEKTSIVSTGHAVACWSLGRRTSRRGGALRSNGCTNRSSASVSWASAVKASRVPSGDQTGA